MNVFEAIDPIQLSDRTLELIREAIIDGRLLPGEPLRDRALAEQLGVSRTPVREALHRLEATGLVVPRERSGWEVSAFTEQDVREVFQLRRLLEPAALRELAEVRDESAMAEIGGFFRGYTRPIPKERYPEYFAHDNAFHTRIITCSQNARIRNIYSLLEHTINRGRHFLVMSTPTRADETLDEHLAISEAVSAGDFDMAVERLLLHLQTGQELMIEQLCSRLDRD